MTDASVLFISVEAFYFFMVPLVSVLTEFHCQIVMQASCESRTVLSKLITETVRCARTLLTGSILYPHSRIIQVEENCLSQQQ